MRAIVHFLACFVFLSISVNGQVLFGPQESVSKNPGISRAVFAGDMDGDGDEDILYSNYLGNSMFWCENYIVDNTITPLPGFQFSTGRLITDEAEGVECIYVADLDRDGDLDVLSASTHYDEVVWYENNGNGVFGNKNIITNEVDNPYSIFAADIDLDGDLDVLSASGFDSKIAWYENNGVGGFGEQNVISTSFYDTRSVYASDLDGDGDMDVLSASGFDGKIAWYENDGKGKFLDPYIVSVQVASANTAFAIDLDGDGDNDVLSASYKKIAWYENDGNANFGDQIIISTTVENPTSLYATDFDSDGKNDILVSSFEEQKIVWYKNLGNGEFSDELIIGSDLEDVYSCYVADVDEDGNKDVFSTTNNQLIWYKNLTKLHQIEVFSFQDFNYDGVYDESDNPFPNQKFSLTPSAKVKFSNSAGTTYYFAKNGEYELKHQENTLWELTTQPEVHSIEINENSELPIYYFGFKPTRILPRVEPHLSSSPTRCNTSAIYWLSYSNTGTTIGAGVVTLEVDELMDFIEATPTPDVIENGILTWYFSDLYPSYHNKIRLDFKMPNEQSIGEILETQATVQLFNESEELVGSKTTEYSSVIRCSYDPNDKLTRSNLLGQSEFAYLEDTIHYTIRFQNTGNDTAFNIRIEDKLNKKLDWTTFHPITASHDYHTTLNRETGLVNFYFDNILLPDSGTNQIGSNGFVTFGIASLANIGDKTEVDNTAFIFFDFNPPIITNTAILTLIQQVETDIEVSDARYSIAVYPNPFSDFTTIEVSGLSSGNYRLELMDIFGRKLRELKVENGKSRIERGDLEGGLYLFQVLKEGGELVGMGKILVE